MRLLKRTATRGAWTGTPGGSKCKLYGYTRPSILVAGRTLYWFDMTDEQNSRESNATPRVPVSLGSKLVGALGILLVVWGVSAYASRLIFADSVWRDVIALAIPLGLTVVGGGILVRRTRERFERMFAAADQLARGDWDSPISIPPEGPWFDETDQLLWRMERIRTNTFSVMSRINDAGSGVQTTSIGLSQTAEDLYKDIATFSAALNSLTKGAEDQLRMAEEMQTGMDGVHSEAANHRTLAEDAEESSTRLQSQVADGGQKMELVLRSWESTIDSLRTAGEGIEIFEGTAREIGQIAELIGDVAKRTNILSMNASLEAARAGEQGEPIAVLATEIRTLAEDTGRKSEQIESLLEGFVGGQRELLGRLGQGIQQLTEGREEVGTVRTNLQEIVAGMEGIANHIVSMARGFGSLAERITDMRKQSEQVQRISADHASVTRETVGATRDQMLVGADRLLTEGRNLDRIARDLSSLVDRVRSKPGSGK